MEDISFIVIEGIHKNPNDINTIEKSSKKTYGPFKNKERADELAKNLIQKNVDNFYHRAWVLKGNIELNSICEECNNEDLSVKSNLIMHGYKICNICKTSKIIFPI